MITKTAAKSLFLRCAHKKYRAVHKRISVVIHELKPVKNQNDRLLQNATKKPLLLYII